jgi:hypothetical protein
VPPKPEAPDFDHQDWWILMVCIQNDAGIGIATAQPCEKSGFIPEVAAQIDDHFSC